MKGAEASGCALEHKEEKLGILVIRPSDCSTGLSPRWTLVSSCQPTLVLHVPLPSKEKHIYTNRPHVLKERSGPWMLWLLRFLLRHGFLSPEELVQR